MSNGEALKNFAHINDSTITDGAPTANDALITDGAPTVNDAYDYPSRRVIEALRSGVSSREVGQCFTSARPKLVGELAGALKKTADDHISGGMIVTGKYGEGKTHLLNTALGMAHDLNMVVSKVTLSKETPMSSLPNLYHKILRGAYLPGETLPGISRALEEMTPGRAYVRDLTEFCQTGLSINRIYYVLKSWLATRDDDEKYALLADMEGDFIANARLRQVYKRVYGKPVNFNVNFSKTKHIMDYFAFISRLFLSLGYRGWVILFDEAELTGRLSKKSRLNAYLNMHKLFKPERMEATYCIYAFNASYIPDVIDAKNEEANVASSQLPQESKEAIGDILSSINLAPQLTPLNRDETLEILGKIQEFHGKAYGWKPAIDTEKAMDAIEKRGYLLRTHIRTMVELLDQLYQYGEAGDIKISELDRATFEEDEDGADEDDE